MKIEEALCSGSDLMCSVETMEAGGYNIIFLNHINGNYWSYQVENYPWYRAKLIQEYLDRKT